MFSDGSLLVKSKNAQQRNKVLKLQTIQDDSNGEIIEEIMDEKGLVCLNDRSGTRVNLVKGTESAINLTLVSHALGWISKWKV